MPIRTIVCLANSFKYPNGRCIAGRELRTNSYGGWIRPVSDRETAELSSSECKYGNNTTPQLLDIIDIPLLRAEPRHHQTENYIIGAGTWVKKGQLDWNQLGGILENPASLWINSDSTSAGMYDRISQEEAYALHNSLLFIKPDSIRIHVEINPWTNKKQTRGDFVYQGTNYNLKVTDPVACSIFQSKESGVYPLEEVYLCVSLTEPWENDNNCYKLVAAIITQQPLR